MDYQIEEREINLKRMIFSCLHQWRRILVVAVALAVLLGGYRAASLFTEMSDPLAREQNDEDYAEALLQYQNEKGSLEAQIENLRNNIGNQQKYMTNSVLMSIDPYNFYRGTISISVNAKDPTRVNDILLAYQSAMEDGKLMTDVAKELGIGEQYLRELITAKVDTSAKNLNNLLTVSIAHPNREGAQKALNLIAMAMDELIARLNKEIAQHKANIVVCSVSACTDPLLAWRQEQERKNQAEQLDLLEDAEELLEELSEPGDNALTLKSVIKSGIKYAILGGAIGVFIVVGMGCISFVLGDRLYSGDELKSRYRVTILSDVLSEGKKFWCLDAWLRRLEGRTVGCPEEFDLAAANIRNYAGQAKKILVTSAAGVEVSRMLTEGLTGKTGLELIPCGSLLRDPAALENLGKCDAVVMVEKCRVSRYSDIAVMLDRIGDARKPLLGCVIEEC